MNINILRILNRYGGYRTLTLSVDDRAKVEAEAAGEEARRLTGRLIHSNGGDEVCS